MRIWRTYVRFLPVIVLTVLLFDLKAQQVFFKTQSLPGEFKDCVIVEMLQDKDGMMWLGTSCGLLRFDGYVYDAFPGLMDEVSALAPAAGNSLLAGLGSGDILRFNTGSLSIQHLEKRGSDHKFTAIAESGDGTVFLADYGRGICILKNDTLIYLDAAAGLADVYVYDLLLDEKGRLWAASDGGIDIISFGSHTSQIENLNTDHGLPDIMIPALSMDADGKVWAGAYEGGFCRIDPENMRVDFMCDGDEWIFGSVTDLLPFGDELWLATDNSGLVRYNLATKKVQSFTDFKGAKIPGFDGLMKDREGNLWVWFGNLLVQSPAMRFEFVYGTDQNELKDVHALMIDNMGFLWYASGQGLFRHAPDFDSDAISQQIPLPSEISYRDITCLHQDAFGYVWIGTFGEGLYRLNPEFLAGNLFTEASGFINNNILSISAIKNEIWFATLGGASRATIDIENPSQLTFEDFDETQGAGNNFIFCVLADGQNRVWFAADGTGISVLERGQFTNFGIDSGLSSEIVYIITEDDKGTIWCVTHDNIVYYFADGRFVEVDVGLNGQFAISALQADNFGNLIIVHESGLNIYNPETANSKFYGRQYGIGPIDPEFNSIARAADGTIWIATENGLIKFSSEKATNSKSPHPVITDLAVLFSSIDHHREFNFKYDQNYFTFHFAGLWFQNPEAVQCRVKLLGNDLEWIVTRERQITYSNLAPGTYTFVVEASQNRNFTNAQQATYGFEIHKPFWNMWWFYGLMAAGVALLIFVYIRIRIKRLKRIEALEKERIQFQLETLRSQVNPHFLFNSFSTLMSTIEDDKDLALEYVEKLSAFFRNILEFRDQDLISLNEELAIVENYIYLQQSRFGSNLLVSFELNDEIRKTLVPPMTVQLLIENAIKHNVISKAKPLRVSVRCEGNFLCIENKLQKKSQVSDSTGFGLNTIRHRYKLIGELDVEIVESADTFIVKLPLIID